MEYLKRKSGLLILDRLANLENKYRIRHFWVRVYYVNIMGLREATLAKYVREQAKYHQMMDRMTACEPQDPFRGSEVIDAQGLKKVKAAS